MNTETTKKLLKEAGREELIEIITSMSNFSEEAEEWFLNYCRKYGKTTDKSLLGSGTDQPLLGYCLGHHR